MIIGKKKLSLVALALLVALSLSLSACAPKSEDSGKNGTPSDTFVVGLPGSISTLDINQAGGIIDYYIASITQEGLVGVSNDGKLIPGLAQSWEEKEDGKVWTFKLREDAKFHDGSDVTPEDIIYTVERVLDPEQSPGLSSYFPTYVESTEKTADDEVTFTLDGPHPGFLWQVSNSGALFVTKKAFVENAKSYGSPEDLTIGTGPYKPVEFEPGSHVTFEQSDAWTGEKSQYKTIRFDFIEDNNTRLLAFQQGDIDFTYNIAPDQEEQWKSVQGATIEFKSDRSYQGLTFDTHIKPFDDEHVRKAIAYAIDKDSIVDGLLLGHAQAATAIPSPEQLGSEDAEALLNSVTHFDFNIEKAKEELALSSSPNGFDATLTYPDSDKNMGKASLAIQDSLKQININLEVKEIPLEQWISEVGNGEQGVAWMSYIPTTGEPGEPTAWLLYADGESNPALWSDEKALELTDQAYSAPDNESQIPLVIEANDIAQKQVIYAPVYWGQAGYALNKGVSIDGLSSYTLLANWSLLFEKVE